MSERPTILPVGRPGDRRALLASLVAIAIRQTKEDQRKGAA